MNLILIFFLLSSVINSFGDALKFSGATRANWVDFLWHCVKYFIQIPLWMFTGYFTFSYILDHALIDFWHPQWDHFNLCLIVVGSIALWQVVYFVTTLILRNRG